MNRNLLKLIIELMNKYKNAERCDNIECINEGNCVVEGIFGVCKCLPGENLLNRFQNF